MAQPRLSDSAVQELLGVGPFLGIDAGDASYFVDAFHATDSLNVVPNRKFQGYLTARGRSNAFTGPFLAPTWGAAQFQRLGQPDLYLVAANNSNTGHGALQAATIGQTPTTLTTPHSLSENQETSFAEAQGWMFMTNNSDVPLKIDTNLNVTNWQIAPPTTIPTIGSFAGPASISLSTIAGTSDGHTVYFSTTYVDAQGNESSANNSNTNITPTTGQQIKVSSPPASPGAVSYNVYATETNGGPYYRQNATPIALGSTYTVLGTPTITGVQSVVWAGNLRGYYSWFVTFGTDAQESSPNLTPAQDLFMGNLNFNGAILTNPQIWITNNSADQSSGLYPITAAGPALLTNIPVSPDGQTTRRNIYRLGGTMQDILLVGTIFDNTTTSFVDNTADLNLVGQSLITHRDPPQPFFSITWFKGRMWGFGYAGNAVGEPNQILGNSDLWYSNYQEPWGFNNVSQVFDVGRNIGGDFAVKAEPLGSILCLLKSESFWAYYGGDNPGSDPPPFQLAPIGCASKKSVASGYGRLFFVSSEGAVWMFDGSNFTNISDNRTTGARSSIKRVLDALAPADFAASAGAVVDNMYLCSFPTQGITYLYDIPSGQWFKLGWAADRFVYNTEEQNTVIAAEPGTGVFDSWFATPTDLGLSITSSYISRITDSGAPQATKRYRYAVVLAPVQAGSTATVTTTVNPGSLQTVNTRSVDLSKLPIKHVISMPPTMLGDEVQVTISVTSNQDTEIHRCSVLGWIERQLVAQG